MPAAKKGDIVRVNYSVCLEDGTVVDSSAGGEPLEFEAGGAQVIPGVANAVIDMEAGDKKTVEVQPEEGYGPHMPEAVQRLKREQIPPEAKEGDQLRANAGGQELMVWVKELGDDYAVIDANHPLAGKVLTFDLEMVEVKAQ